MADLIPVLRSVRGREFLLKIVTIDDAELLYGISRRAVRPMGANLLASGVCAFV